MKKYQYTCHRCKIQFQSHLDAAHDRVICPCCRQIMMMADLTGVEEDTPVIPSITVSPVEVQPVGSTPIEVRPVSSSPLPPQSDANAANYYPQPEQTYDNTPAPQVEVVAQVTDYGSEEQSDDAEPVGRKPVQRYVLIALAGIVIGLVVLAAILYFTGNIPTEEYAVAEEEVSAENKEAIAAEGLKEYLEEQAIRDVSQYFLIDIDGDGQREVLANSSKNLIAFSGENGTAVLLCHEEVLEWIWVDNHGLFVVTEDNASTSGEAKWMVKHGQKLDVDITKDIYHFGYGAYYINHEGKDKVLTKSQYYDKVNAVIGKYTKLNPVNFENEE